MKKPRKLCSLRGFSFSSYFGGWTGIEPVTRGFSIRSLHLLYARITHQINELRHLEPLYIRIVQL